jgi:hypothetical protein
MACLLLGDWICWLLGSGTTCWLQDQNFEPRNSGLVLPKLQFFNMHCSLYIYMPDYTRIYL